MRGLGHLLMWGGFLAGAFFSVSQLEIKDDKWATIPWLWYIFSIGVGGAGVILLRNSRQRDLADDDKTEAEYSVIQTSLAAVSEIIAELSSRDGHVPEDVVATIDDRCVEPLADFADAREALVKRFGLHVYAEVMTEFAAAERYINRSWSAAADGYVDEVTVSLKRANTHLQEAGKLLAAAES